MLATRHIKRLSASSDERRRQIANALTKASTGTLNPEESAWIERIEIMRVEYDQSSEPIQQVDFGSGISGTDQGTQQAVALNHGVERLRTVGEISRLTSKDRRWATLLFQIVRAARPLSGLELGTALGLSGAYQAAALELNGQGTMVTVEGAPAFAKFATGTFNRLGLDTIEVRTGRFNDVLPDLLPTLQPIDYAFIDGHHDEHATVDYFEQILPFLASGSVLVFDDIRWSAGMSRAWKEVVGHPEVTAAVDLINIGLCIVNGTDQAKIILSGDDLWWKMQHNPLTRAGHRLSRLITR
jgi:predicted O-methyltransferase YrrM